MAGLRVNGIDIQAIHGYTRRNEKSRPRESTVDEIIMTMGFFALLHLRFLIRNLQCGYSSSFFEGVCLIFLWFPEGYLSLNISVQAYVSVNVQPREYYRDSPNLCYVSFLSQYYGSPPSLMLCRSNSFIGSRQDKANGPPL
jgi:hypothetical protein